MQTENLEQLITQGLKAMHAGGAVAAKATSEIQSDASHPQLQQALREGSETSKNWHQRIEKALNEAGGQPDDGMGEPVLEAHYEVSKRIRSDAPTDEVRDLGIVANGQMALHYWIAAFGTMRAYTEQLGMDDVAADMKACAEEAGRADEQHTQIAQAIMQGDQTAAAA